MASRGRLGLCLVATSLGVALVSFAGCGDDGGGGGGSDSGPTPCDVAAQCDDDDPCTIDRCGEDGFCTADPAPDGEAPEQEVGDCRRTFCEGGDARNEEDVFDVEDDLEACTIDRCDGDDVVHTPLADGASCQVGRGTGTCSNETCVVPCTAFNAQEVCDDLNPCTQDGCIGEGADGVCKHGAFSGPTPGVGQNTGDCKEQRCVEGVDTLVNDDYDVPDDGNECTEKTCIQGEPLIEPSPAGTSCQGDYACDGEGQCIECLSVADCPDEDEDYPCYVPACEDGYCTQAPAPEGTALPPTYQYEGDCAFTVCDGFGGTTGQPDDDDVPPDSSECQEVYCSGGSVQYDYAEPGTPCGSGGQVCNETGSCCQPYDCDQIGAQCGTIDNGCGESIQCGGCDVGESCVDNVCCGATQTCEDLGKNCGTYFACGETLECGECVDPLDSCGPSIANVCGCTDGVQNQGELGVDCGGPCSAGCDDGTPCDDGGDCASGFCVDFICCDSLCSGTCQACDDFRTGEPDGTCADVLTGTDPDNECTMDAVTTCDRTGFCEAGACQLYPAGTECGPSQCIGVTETSADQCNGTGTCVDTGSTTCAGSYVCSGDRCETCDDGVFNGDEVNVDCGGGGTCPGCAEGMACPNGPSDCASGFCVDGVCCDTACTGLCLTCALAGNQGTCSPRTAGTDPQNECPGNQTCNGAGSCN